MRRTLTTAAIAGIAALMGVLPVSAQNIFTVNPGQTVKVDRHGVCRMVKNAGSNAVMVPTGAAAEWSSGASAFLQNVAGMPGVSVETCIVPGYSGFGGPLYQTCAAAPTGGVYCAGLIGGTSHNTMIRMNSFPLSETFVQIDGAIGTSSGAFTCGVTASSRLYCASGYNDNAVLIGSGYKKISAGSAGGMAAIRTDGKVVKWEDVNNISGTGTLIAGSANAAEIAVHSNAWGLTACYVTDDGSAFCHGKNRAVARYEFFRLGIGSGAPDTAGVVDTGLSNIKDIAASNGFCALSGNGRVYCWGQVPGRPGGPGLQDWYGPAISTPAIIPDLQAKSIKGGSVYCATTIDDRVACWGLATQGLLGSGETQDLSAQHKSTNGFVYTNMPAGSDIVGGGSNGMCANHSGDTYCWGLNYRGELGYGGNAHTNVPRKVQFQ